MFENSKYFLNNDDGAVYGVDFKIGEYGRWMKPALGEYAKAQEI